jgi:hypothetical protein
VGKTVSLLFGVGEEHVQSPVPERAIEQTEMLVEKCQVRESTALAQTLSPLQTTRCADVGWLLLIAHDHA